MYVVITVLAILLSFCVFMLINSIGLDSTIGFWASMTVLLSLIVGELAEISDRIKNNKNG